MENPNTNCLEGKRCPKCKSYGPFRIQATVWLDINDEGSSADDDDHEYDDDSMAHCPKCNHYEEFGHFNA